jgi:hypothetical protein
MPPPPTTNHLSRAWTQIAKVVPGGVALDIQVAQTLEGYGQAYAQA